MAHRALIKMADDEKENLKFMRSLFAVQDINAGEPFTATNVRSIRPSNGLPPKNWSSVIGKRASTNISCGQPLTEDMIVRN